jgi:putative NADH-flavin reductase
MQSEGPYISGLPDNAAVVNKKSGVAYTGLEMRSVNAVCDWMNEAHAEGRKAAEKDVEELLRMASKLRGFDEVFDAWKKARGIE